MQQYSPFRPRVGLFTTCLIETFRPAIGYAAIKLLEDAGCRVEIPEGQQCCGQPSLGDSDDPDHLDQASRIIEAFEGFDFVVAPSASCAASLKDYAALFASNPAWEARAQAFSQKVHELTSFLVDVMNVGTISVRLDANVTFFDSCAGGAEPRFQPQPRVLLSAIAGLSLKEMAQTAGCCGFGSNRCAKTSPAMTEDIRAAGSSILVSGDLSCLMGLARKLKRDGSAIEVRHIAELLAGMHDTPPIGGTTRSTHRPLERQP